MLRLRHAMSDFSLRSVLIAGAIVFAAVAGRLALDPGLPSLPPFITLYPAVALAGLLCGPWAGGFAGLAGLLAEIYFWIPPRLSFAIPSSTDCISIALFVATSLVVLGAAAALRARLEAASVAKHALELGLAAGGVGTWEINLRTRRIAASSTAYALHGLPDGSAQTEPDAWLRGIHPDDVPMARAALQTAVADGTMAAYTYRVLTAPDGPRWIAARGRVVSAGGERRLLCALADITDQVRVQDELRREREQLRLALEAGSLAVWDYHLGTGEVTVDARYATTMGLDADLRTLPRDQIGKRIHPDDRAHVFAKHEGFIADGGDYRIEYRIVTPSGDIRWLVSQGILVKGDLPADPGRMVGIIQDITDGKRREDDLRALAAARELLVREADHRIKNSLQLVASLLSVQLRGIEDRGAADALREAIARVGAIAASHLALQGSEDFKAIDLAVTLRELCAHFTQLHPAVAISCRPGAALMLDADRAIPLALAVSEVITNALRHAFPDRAAGSVVVEAAREDAALLVRVRDDGVGLDPQAGRGGLGSRIIRSLAARIDATIDVESTPKVGTVVTLRMPLAPKDAARPTVMPAGETVQNAHFPA
jgi:two-component sensor histidine kinase/PAS domain-containing protein